MQQQKEPIHKPTCMQQIKCKIHEEIQDTCQTSKNYLNEQIWVLSKQNQAGIPMQNNRCFHNHTKYAILMKTNRLIIVSKHLLPKSDSSCQDAIFLICHSVRNSSSAGLISTGKARSAFLLLPQKGNAANVNQIRADLCLC